MPAGAIVLVQNSELTPKEQPEPSLNVCLQRARLRLFSEPDPIPDGFFISCPALPQSPLCSKERDAQTALLLFLSPEQTSSEQRENLQVSEMGGTWGLRVTKECAVSRVHEYLRNAKAGNRILVKGWWKFQLTVTHRCNEVCETPVQRAEVGAVPRSSSGELSFDRNRRV